MNFIIAMIAQSYEKVMSMQTKYQYRNKANLNKSFMFLRNWSQFFRFGKKGAKEDKLKFNVMIIQYED